MNLYKNKSSWVRSLCAIVITIIFVAIVSLNLLYPLPSGPPDNGDFTRIFTSFSTGPLGHDFWPPLENHDAYQKRFFNFYHRFWRYDEGKKGFVHPSSSRLFFWPGRLLNLTPGIYDLAWNTFLLILIAGCVLYFSLKTLGMSPATISLGALAFVFADVNIAGYLNSFYQELGTFISFFFLICALHFFYARKNLLSLVIVFILSLVLAGTKVAFTLSVLPAVFPLLVGVSFLQPRNIQLRRYIIVATILLFLISIILLKILTITSGGERRANCYHFIFSGAVTFLSPSEGKNFLYELSLAPSLINLRGKNAYQPDSQFGTEPLYSALSTRLHLKAAYKLAFYYPKAFFEMIKFSLSKAGFYPRLHYPSLYGNQGIPFYLRWNLWSRVHDKFLHGAHYYVAVLSLTVILGGLVLKRKISAWLFFTFFPRLDSLLVHSSRPLSPSLVMVRWTLLNINILLIFFLTLPSFLISAV